MAAKVEDYRIAQRFVHSGAAPQCIGPDVELLLQSEVRQTNRTMTTVVNEALRLGLVTSGKPRHSRPFKVEPHAFGLRPGIDRDRFNQLLDNMDAEKFAKRYDP